MTNSDQGNAGFNAQNDGQVAGQSLSNVPNFGSMNGPDFDNSNPLAGLSIEDLMAQAQQMQSAVLAAQQQAAETEVVGESGSGLIRITVTGALEPIRVEVSPKLVDPDNVDLLEDLLLAALRDAVYRASQVSENALSQVSGFEEN